MKADRSALTAKLREVHSAVCKEAGTGDLPIAKEHLRITPLRSQYYRLPVMQRIKDQFVVGGDLYEVWDDRTPQDRYMVEVKKNPTLVEHSAALAHNAVALVPFGGLRRAVAGIVWTLSSILPGGNPDGRMQSGLKQTLGGILETAFDTLGLYFFRIPATLYGLARSSVGLLGKALGKQSPRHVSETKPLKRRD